MCVWTISIDVKPVPNWGVSPLVWLPQIYIAEDGEDIWGSIQRSSARWCQNNLSFNFPVNGKRLSQAPPCWVWCRFDVWLLSQSGILFNPCLGYGNSTGYGDGSSFNTFGISLDPGKRRDSFWYYWPSFGRTSWLLFTMVNSPVLPDFLHPVKYEWNVFARQMHSTSKIR